MDWGCWEKRKISASMSAMSFLVVTSVLLFGGCLGAVDWVYLEIFLIIPRIVFVLVEEPIWLTWFCQLFFMDTFMIFCDFALRSLKALRLMVVGSLSNFRKAPLRRRIAVLQLLLNQDVLSLFEADVFAIVSFAIEIRVRWSVFFGLWC